MVVLGIIYEPLFLYGGTFFANEFTALAKSTQAIAVPKGSTVSWSSIEAPDLRFLMAQGFKGSWLALLGLALLMALFWIVYRSFKKNPNPARKYVDKTNQPTATASAKG